MESVEGLWSIDIENAFQILIKSIIMYDDKLTDYRKALAQDKITIDLTAYEPAAGKKSFDTKQSDLDLALELRSVTVKSKKKTMDITSDIEAALFRFFRISHPLIINVNTRSDVSVKLFSKKRLLSDEASEKYTTAKKNWDAVLKQSSPSPAKPKAAVLPNRVESDSPNKSQHSTTHHGARVQQNITVGGNPVLKKQPPTEIPKASSVTQQSDSLKDIGPDLVLLHQALILYKALKEAEAGLDLTLFPGIFGNDIKESKKIALKTLQQFVAIYVHNKANKNSGFSAYLRKIAEQKPYEDLFYSSSNNLLPPTEISSNKTLSSHVSITKDNSLKIDLNNESSFITPFTDKNLLTQARGLLNDSLLNAHRRRYLDKFFRIKTTRTHDTLSTAIDAMGKVTVDELKKAEVTPKQNQNDKQKKF